MLQTDAIPDWAPPWPAEHHHRFEGALRAALAERLSDFALNMEAGIVALPGQTGRGHAFPCHTIAACCAASGQPERFADIIDQQLDLLSIGLADIALVAELEQDWTRAAAHLKVRLYPTAQVVDNLEQLTHRPLGSGLVAVLVYDLPDSILSVAPDAAAAWPVDDDTLWRRALINVMDGTPSLSMVAFPDSEGRSVLVSGNDCFIPTRLLFIRELVPDWYAPNGLIVSIPHRRAMLFHAVGAGPVMQEALQELTLATYQMFQAAGDPVSGSLYWWREGEADEIPFTVDAERGALEVALPEALISLVASLPE